MRDDYVKRLCTSVRRLDLFVPFCIYVKRPRPSHHLRFTLCVFVTAFLKLQSSLYISLRGRGPLPLITYVFTVFVIIYCFVLVRVCQNETTPPFLYYENIVLENSLQSLFNCPWRHSPLFQDLSQSWSP